MYWHRKDVQIAVFCDVIPHAVADKYMFLGNPLLPHLRSLTQKTPSRTPCCWRREGKGGSQGTVSNKDTVKHLQKLHYHVQRMQTGRNYTSNYIIFNSQGRMTVHLLELQPLMVLLTIPKITDEAIWIVSRMVINRRNLT